MSVVDGLKEAILDEMGDHERVYFCTSVFKGAAQHRNRPRRMACNLHRPFDGVANGGTLVYGEAYAPAGRFIGLDVPDEFYSIKSNHAGVIWWPLEEMIKDGNVSGGEVVEQYPTYGGTAIERVPLA